MIIDIFCHITPAKYSEKLAKVASPEIYNSKINSTLSTLHDMERRIGIMERYEGYRQVLTLSLPPVETVTDSGKVALELSQLANDEMAEVVFKYPDSFLAAVACVPLNDIDLAITEAERAMNELKFRGIQITSSINGKPLDSPEFLPLFEMMAERNLPIWIHPFLPWGHPDYPTETSSQYRTDLVFGWIHQSTLAMARLMFSGIFEKFPNLKIITHHAGAMIPYLDHRIMNSYDRAEFRERDNSKRNLTKSPVESLKMFHCDTALNGNTTGLMAAYEFFGINKMLFATDGPMDTQLGDESIRKTIQAVEKMDITSEEREMIFEHNARRLLQLPL